MQSRVLHHLAPLFNQLLPSNRGRMGSIEKNVAKLYLINLIQSHSHKVIKHKYILNRGGYN